MQRGLSRAVPTLTAAVMVGSCLAGCGAGARHRDRGRHARRTHAVRRGGAAGRSAPAPVGGGSPLSREAPASLRHGELPQVGISQRVTTDGARLTVTLRRVSDPLRGAGVRLPPATRAVAVIVQIRNAGPRLYDSSATGDVRLEVSGGAVTPVLATRGICRTPLEDFDRYITPGEDRVGCVVFAVANGATLDAVWFSPHAHRLGRLTWAP